MKEFLGFSQTDGYSGYNKVDNIKRIYCLAHIWRKFYEIIVNLADESLKKSRAVIGLWEAYSKDEDYYNKRHEIRLEKSDPLLDEFQEYIKREIKNALPKSALAH